MASAVAHLRALATSGRPAGSESESAARRYANTELAALGFTVQEASFEYSAFPGRVATPAAGVALVVTILASAACALFSAMPHVGVVVLLVGLAGTVVFARRMMGNGVLDLPWMRERSVNLVATRGTSAPHVWLVAHLDSKSQPIASAARVVGIAILALAVMLAVVASGLTLTGSAPRTLWWVAVVAGAVGAMPVIASVVGNLSDGAVDNASGVATVLGAAALVRQDVSFGVLIPSAEELGLAGARAFVRGRPVGVALNCDGVDDEGALVIMYNGSVPTRVISAIGLHDRMASASRARRMPLGLLTDSTAFHDAGWETVTVSHGSLETLRRVHTPHDSLARLRGTSIDGVAEILARAVEALAQ